MQTATVQVSDEKYSTLILSYKSFNPPIDDWFFLCLFFAIVSIVVPLATVLLIRISRKFNSNCCAIFFCVSKSMFFSSLSRSFIIHLAAWWTRSSIFIHTYGSCFVPNKYLYLNRRTGNSRYLSRLLPTSSSAFLYLSLFVQYFLFAFHSHRAAKWRPVVMLTQIGNVCSIKDPWETAIAMARIYSNREQRRRQQNITLLFHYCDWIAACT